ncbi:MAG: hypothetical protein JSS36_01275 [Proteobacteria bacterium]|nr:hypothetical protein [Pseudomonadota bacterium]
MSRRARRREALRQIAALSGLAEWQAEAAALRAAAATLQAEALRDEAGVVLRGKVEAWEAGIFAPLFDPALTSMWQTSVLLASDGLKRAETDLAGARLGEADCQLRYARAGAQLRCARQIERDVARRLIAEREERQIDELLEAMQVGGGRP